MEESREGGTEELSPDGESVVGGAERTKLIVPGSVIAGWHKVGRFCGGDGTQFRQAFSVQIRVPWGGGDSFGVAQINIVDLAGWGRRPNWTHPSKLFWGGELLTSSSERSHAIFILCVSHFLSSPIHQTANPIFPREDSRTLGRHHHSLAYSHPPQSGKATSGKGPGVPHLAAAYGFAFVNGGSRARLAPSWARATRDRWLSAAKFVNNSRKSPGRRITRS